MTSNRLWNWWRSFLQGTRWDHAFLVGSSLCRNKGCYC